MPDIVPTIGMIKPAPTDARISLIGMRKPVERPCGPSSSLYMFGSGAPRRVRRGAESVCGRRRRERGRPSWW
jgi:hypothetical protein